MANNPIKSRTFTGRLGNYWLTRDSNVVNVINGAGSRTEVVFACASEARKAMNNPASFVKEQK